MRGGRNESVKKRSSRTRSKRQTKRKWRKWRNRALLAAGVGVAAYAAHQNQAYLKEKYIHANDYLNTTGAYSHSEVITNQRSEGTCHYHAAAKVMLQNFFQFLVPMNVDQIRFKENDCSRFADHPSQRLLSLADTSESACSEGGYIKLVLFQYLYYLLFDVVNPTNTTGYNGEGTSLVIHKYFPLLRDKSMPRFFYDKEPALREQLIPKIYSALDAAEKSRIELGVTYYVIWVEYSTSYSATLIRLIERVTGLGFYLMLHLVDARGGQHGRHAVHIVDTENGELVFKNSWGESTVYKYPIDGIVDVGSYRFKTYAVTFVLPLTTKPSFVKDDESTSIRSLSPNSANAVLQMLEFMNAYTMGVPSTSAAVKVGHLARDFVKPAAAKLKQFRDYFSV